MLFGRKHFILVALTRFSGPLNISREVLIHIHAVSAVPRRLRTVKVVEHAAGLLLLDAPVFGYVLMSAEIIVGQVHLRASTGVCLFSFQSARLELFLRVNNENLTAALRKVAGRIHRVFIHSCRLFLPMILFLQEKFQIFLFIMMLAMLAYRIP